MRKALTIGIVAVMVLMGFVAMANPIAAAEPSITKLMYIDGEEPFCIDAWLGEKIYVKIEVYNVPAEGGTVVDELNSMFAYIPGSYMVDDVPAIPTIMGGKIIQPVEEGYTKIEFKLLYHEAPAVTTMVWNTATLYYGECEDVSAEDNINAQKYCGINKGPLGPHTVTVGTDVHWDFFITVTNLNLGFTMYDVEIWDRFGAEIEGHGDPVVSMGSYNINLKGNSKKIFLYWDVGDLVVPPPGEGEASSARLDWEISTDTNPKGHQEYTSPSPPCDPYEMNSGVVLKFKNAEGIQFSAHTPQIFVHAVEP
jgi:hypothetical protein